MIQYKQGERIYIYFPLLLKMLRSTNEVDKQGIDPVSPVTATALIITIKQRCQMVL